MFISKWILVVQRSTAELALGKSKLSSCLTSSHLQGAPKGTGNIPQMKYITVETIVSALLLKILVDGFHYLLGQEAEA